MAEWSSGSRGPRLPRGWEGRSRLRPRPFRRACTILLVPCAGQLLERDPVGDPLDVAASVDPPPEISDFLEVLGTLRAALRDEHGKIRAVDVRRLVGLDLERWSYYRARLIARAMRHLGWTRRRCRFAGALAYAYVRGTPLQREGILDVDRGEDGRLVVRRRSS